MRRTWGGGGEGGGGGGGSGCAGAGGHVVRCVRRPKAGGKVGI